MLYLILVSPTRSAVSGFHTGHRYNICSYLKVYFLRITLSRQKVQIFIFTIYWLFYGAGWQVSWSETRLSSQCEADDVKLMKMRHALSWRRKREMWRWSRVWKLKKKKSVFSSWTLIFFVFWYMWWNRLCCVINDNYIFLSKKKKNDNYILILINEYIL